MKDKEWEERDKEYCKQCKHFHDCKYNYIRDWCAMSDKKMEKWRQSNA